MVNNIKKLSNADRKEIAESPELLNMMVSSYGVRDDLVDYVRAALTVADAKARAKEALAELKVPPTDHTVSDVFDVTGASGLGPAGESICKPPLRWDPITETCVPA